MQYRIIIKERKLRGLGLVLFLHLFSLQISAQVPALPPGKEGDTLIVKAEEKRVVIDTIEHSPRKAVIYAAVLPGLGQIYNKKYWKVPIVYAGFGTFGYFIDRNIKYYKDLRQGYLDYPEHDLKYFPNEITQEQIKRGMNIYKRYRDMSFIGITAFYVLQIIDATVDAYLFDWNVGQDISLRIEPSPVYPFNMPGNAFGLRACLSF